MTPLVFYKCLADETRLRSLLLVQLEGELCVCELTHALDEIQPKVSRHLAQLRKCELLVDRRQGQWIFYRLNPSLPDWAKSVLAVTAANSSVFLKDNSDRLRLMRSPTEAKSICCP